ncbi:MAG TPA: hypothetical protein VGD40_25015 [Chryseosolibacter sp.]
MPDHSNTDNLFTEGSLVTAKQHPEVPLKVVRYYQRIYYCARVGDETRKQLVYFERELLPTRGGSAIFLKTMNQTMNDRNS